METASIRRMNLIPELCYLFTVIHMSEMGVVLESSVMEIYFFPVLVVQGNIQVPYMGLRNQEPRSYPSHSKARKHPDIRNAAALGVSAVPLYARDQMLLS